jgi:hypothetical protein
MRTDLKGKKAQTLIDTTLSQTGIETQAVVQSASLQDPFSGRLRFQRCLPAK